MGTKEEKEEIKKSEKLDKNNQKEEYNDMFVICIILLANIFYTLPLAIAGSKALPLTYLIYIVFPILIAVISIAYGYSEGKDYKLAVIMYILLMPALILLATSNILYQISIYFIIAFCYFVLSIAATYFGDYARDLEIKAKLKEKKNVKAKAKIMAKKEKVEKDKN